jgi:hypothetical protein
MKKKRLLFLLLMALFAPLAANAQETVEIGTDGGTTNNSYLPGYTLYDNTLSEQIYTAEEVTMAGTISSIAFYNGGSTKSPTVTLYMVNTDKETFSSTSDWLTVTSSDKVYEGSVTFTAGEWTTITLDTPFDYDGSSNLGLVAHVHMDQYSSGLSCRVFTSTDNCSMYAYRDNTVYNPTNPGVNASGRLSVKNQIKLEITPSSGVTCAKPTNLKVSNITSSTADITWQSTAEYFNFEFKKSADEQWTPIQTPYRYYNAAELEPNTTYDVRVKAVCSFDPLEESAYATTQFTTDCGVITSFPWTEDFESYEANTIPSCWDNSASTTSTLSSNPERIWGVYGYNDNKMLRMYNYFVQSGTALINTNPIALPEEEVYQLAFDYSHRASCGAFKVKISTDGGTTFTDLQSYTSTGSNEYTNPGTFTTAEPISLADYAGQTVILQFYADANYGSGAIFLDNVSISKVPTCLPPTGLTVSFTETGYRFSWDAESGYEFYYTDAPVVNTPVWSASYTTDNYVDYLNHQLGYNEDWTFYLKKKCSEDDYSEPVSVTFHTKCAATTALGYTENFDGYTVSYASSPSTRTLPDCWNAINTTTYATYSVYPSIYNYNNAHSGSNCIRFYSYYSSYSSYDPQPQYAILPVMDDLGGVQVTLQAKGYNDASTFKVGTMTDLNDATTFTAIYEQALTTSYQRFVYNIPANTTDKYLVFMIDAANSSRNTNGVYIDDIAIPTCSEPTDLEVLELTAHSVTIAWYAEGGDMFQEDFNTSSFDPNEPPTSWSHTPDYYNQAHWDGLEPNHFYGIWVRKYCSETDQSAPVYITFTTPEACPAPTGLHVVEGSITSTGASFTWDAEEGATFQYYTIENPWEGFAPTEETSWTSTTNNSAGWANAFSPNTTQRFYLRKDCGNDGYSDYTYVEFRTLCGPVSLVNNYTENFNDYTGVSTGTTVPGTFPNDPLPHCWQFLNRGETSSSYPMVFISNYSGYPVDGNCLFFKSSSTTPLYAILPEFVQDISEYQLTFSYRNEGTNDYNGTLYVGYMTDPSDANTFVQTLACERTTTLTEKTAYFANAQEGSFMAFKYEGGTNNNYYLSIDNVVVSNGPACFPTGTLDCVELSSTTATLSWTLIDFQQNAWVVEYSTTPQFFEPVVSVDASQNWNFVIEGLEPKTQYYARVRGNCGEGSLSDASNTITFTTLDACPLPTNLVASNLTQNTADLSWTGSVDVQQYQVWFRRAEQVVGINEQFNANLLPDRWERKQGLLDNIMNGTENLTSGDYNWYMGTTNGVFDSHAYINIFGTSRKDWLITPSHNVQSGDVVIFDLALTAYSGTQSAPATTGTDDRFVVLVTIDNGQTWTILREWNNSVGSQYVYNDIAHTATGEQVRIDLTEYAGWDVRIAFYGESTERNADNNLHIDNVKIGTEYAAGGGSIVESQTTSVQLVGLEANMIYDVQVRSICSDTWTDIFNFKTLDQNTKVFIGGQPLDGYDLEEVSDKWWNPNNWVPYGMPGAVNDSPNEDVILRHDAVISINLITGRNIIADANSITFEGDPKPTLTLEDGNQLRLNTIIDQPDVITVKKNIIGYAGTKDQYYLISSPVQWAGQYNPANGIVTTESDYDLYAFDPAASDGLEWRNYKADPTNFKMDWGSGYLYANDADVMISVTGPVMDNKQPDEIFNYNYFENEDYQFNGWKLCGNTFTCNAYLSSDSQTMAFYRMNAEGTGFEAVTSVIKPMEGFFLQNTVRGESVVLSRTAPSKGVRCLNLVLSQVAARRDGVSTGSTTLDNAIVRFDEGNTLEKLSFREGSSKIYMPVEGKDYAVVNAGQMGELPVSFKAESNGSYTLSFTNEDVEFSYLHLIDNLTGDDVDLLTHPSYSFNASTTDYASRFRLVFATGTSVEGDNFSFVNASGNLCIFGIEGEATVQVIDILGHVISSETFSGSYERKINGAPGVYMVRLINGNDVKVQKVVVR